MPPTVSLAVMVRDDAERLRRCIRSVKDVVDTVVVLDTGSKDNTVETATEEGAAVSQIEWPGSFSEGLNALLDRVETDWVLRLDSDEWFESPPASMRNLIEDEEAFGYLLLRRDIQPDGTHEDIALPRLWRAHRDLRFRGLVHENIPHESFLESWPGKVQKASPLWFWHDGYSAGHAEKIRRNVELMEQELAAHPGQSYYEALLVKGYKDLDDPRWREKATAFAQRAVQTDTRPSPISAIVFADLISSLQGPELTEPAGEKLVAKANEWFGEFPAIQVAISNFELRRGNRAGALDALIRIADMAETGQYNRSLPVAQSLFAPAFWKHLDRLADQLGRWDICKRCDPHL